MTATLLAIGDIHLGRRPSRLPDDLAAHGLDADQLGPAGAWRGVVEHAIAHRVDAVLLAGDVVEAERDFYEAFGLLDVGVRRLLGAGIPVLAVAGNHDVAVLPRLAAALPGFRLLGAGGSWELAVLPSAREPAVRVVGWSFPSARVGSVPIADLPAVSADGVPGIGLLHCDLDAPGGPYAPVRSRDLLGAWPHAWLLGHVHAPSPLSGARPVGYLGSLVGLDPSETGTHGPWRITLDDGRVVARQLPLAPLRWEELPVDVTGLADPADVQPLLLRAIEQRHAELEAAGAAARAVGLRVVLHGATPHGPRLRAWCAGDDVQRLRLSRGRALYFVERVEHRTRPAVDLSRVAEGTDPPAVLARLLRTLDAAPDDVERASLLAGARTALERERGPWREADRPPLSDDALADVLRRAGTRALEELLAQQAEGA